jgi:hypothetical protein
MEQAPFNAKDSAAKLGIEVSTLYSWLGLSDRGLLVIRGQAVTIAYFQGGAAGEGRIQLEDGEVERLRELMRVRPDRIVPRRPSAHRDSYPGIHVKLGVPSG